MSTKSRTHDQPFTAPTKENTMSTDADTTTADPFAAFEAAVFEDKQDHRAQFNGTIPPQVQAFVNRLAESGKRGLLPFTGEKAAEMRPVIQAAAGVLGKSATMRDVVADPAKNITAGLRVTIGDRRGRKVAPVADAPVADAK